MAEALSPSTGAERPLGLVLVGGASRRMGRDKALLPFGDVPMAEHAARVLDPVCSRVFLSAPPDHPARSLGRPVLTDRIGGRGPLDGIAAALAQGDVAVLACDMPFVSTAFFETLVATPKRWAGAMYKGRRAEPLAALYRRRTLDRALAVLKTGDGSMQSFAADLDILYLGDAVVRRLDVRPEDFINVNDAKAYDEALRRWERDAGDSGRGGRGHGPRS